MDYSCLVYVQGMSNFSFGKTSLHCLLQGRDQTTELNRRLRKYKLLLPEVLLQKGVSNLGELSRLQPAIQKLLNGMITARTS